MFGNYSRKNFEVGEIDSTHFDQIVDKTQRLSQKIGFDYLTIVQKRNISPSAREGLLDIIHEQCRLKNSSKTAEQLSIYYLDLILSLKYFPQGDILKLITLTCTSLALKFEDSRKIMLEELFNLTDNKFSLEIIKTIEIYILKTLNWELDLVTPDEIIRNLLRSHFKSDDAEEMVNQSSKFVNVALRDYEMCKNSALFIGIAAVLCCFRSMEKTESIENWFKSIRWLYGEEIEVKNLSMSIWAKFNSIKN